MPLPFRDLTKDRFGRLIAMWPAGLKGKPRGRVYWMTACDCGVYKAIHASSLLKGDSRSCGCLNREVAKKLNTVHGHAAPSRVTSEYLSYRAAKKRCHNPSHDSYKYYGGRGIKFLFKSFEEFLVALGPKPSPKHSVDRINNDGHYEPSNVRWATASEQQANRHKHHYLEVA